MAEMQGFGERHEIAHMARVHSIPQKYQSVLKMTLDYLDPAR
jgi:hypothetical protein